MLSRFAKAAGAMVTAVVGPRRGRVAVPGEEPWTAERLREVLRDELAGRRLVVVSNRAPLLHQWQDGRIAAERPAGGLVTAIESVMRACSGVWIAHGSGTADQATADSDGRVIVPGEGGSYRLRRVWLSDEEVCGYYDGFANEGLWPLCHRAHIPPVFRRRDWADYRLVNQRFADAVVEEAGTDAPFVLVQDYHLALVPRLLRQRLPRAMILTFWHIPWPDPDQFAICPYQEELIDGLLGSTTLGLQTPSHCRNFLDSLDRTLEARIDRDDTAVVYQGRATAIRPYPISVEWPSRWVAPSPPIATCRKTVRDELGCAADARLVVSVDRLDYTKGIVERLLSFERVLEWWPRTGEPIAFLQVASPSRLRIDRYRECGDRVRALVDRINARFSAGGRPPITLINRHCEPPEVFRYYRAADVCYVSSLHDGMNLVAKEFVAARDDDQGVLLLSRFTGAARELSAALVVNPYDVDGVAETLLAALMMPRAEQLERMRAMRAVVAASNVYAWAGRLVTDAFRWRRREDLLDQRPAADARNTFPAAV